MFYVIGITVFFATRSLERFWSGILIPSALFCSTTSLDTGRWWRRILFLTWSPTLANGVFLYNRLLWIGVGASLGGAWTLFPMSVEALTARAQGRRAAKAKEQDLAEAGPVRSLVIARLPRCIRPLLPRLHSRSTSRSPVCA